MENFYLTPFKVREITPKIYSNLKYIKNVDSEKFLSGYPLNKYWTFEFLKENQGEVDSIYINKKYIK